jgi:hypothetical protein
MFQTSRLNACLLMSGLMLGTCTGIAHAQDFSAMIDANAQSAFSIAGTTAINSAIDHSARYAARNSRTAPYASGPAPQPLVQSPPIGAFRSSAGVTDRVNDRFASLLGRGMPDKQAQIDSMIRSGSLQQTFGSLMSSYGFDRYNIADVMTAYYIVMWEIVHDRVPTPTEIRATRSQMLLGMADASSLGRMSNDQKQDAAETLTLVSALALTSYETFKRQGDRNGLSVLQDALLKSVRQQGIDIDQLAMTEQGFVRR